MAKIHNDFSFDVGLEQVSRLADPGPVRLPDAADLVPGETGFSTQLVDLLYPPSIEQALLRSLRPDIEHRGILNPPAYHAALEDCRADLDQCLAQDPDHPHQEKLRACLHEVSNELEMNRLLLAYRHLLHRG